MERIAQVHTNRNLMCVCVCVVSYDQYVDYNNMHNLVDQMFLL